MLNMGVDLQTSIEATLKMCSIQSLKKNLKMAEILAKHHLEKRLMIK